MNKVLVTGLGIGNSFGICPVCSLDYSWLIYNPSTLIWADKILIAKNSWEKRRITRDKQDLAVNVVLEIAHDNGLIELFDAKDIFVEEISDKIEREVVDDVDKLLKTFPNAVLKGDEKVPGEILLDGVSFCHPKLASLYGSLKIASALDANCLLHKHDYEYLKYKSGIDSLFLSKATVMSEIMSVYLPNELIVHNYAFETEEKCIICAKLKECESTYLKKIEADTHELMNWRNYDEIGRAKEELEKIINLKYSISRSVDIFEVKKEFEAKQLVINKKIRSIFPKIKRWTSMATALAVPATIYSASTGNMPAAGVSASLLGISEIAKRYMEHFESNSAWVGFINKSRSNVENDV